jgi:hypothetical protein
MGCCTKCIDERVARMDVFDFLSVRMLNLENYSTDIHDIWYRRSALKVASEFHFEPCRLDATPTEHEG